MKNNLTTNILLILVLVLLLVLGFTLLRVKELSTLLRAVEVPYSITQTETQHWDTLPRVVIDNPTWIRDTTILIDSIPTTYSEYSDTVKDSSYVASYFLRAADLDSFNISFTPIAKTILTSTTITQPVYLDKRYQALSVILGLNSSPELKPLIGIQYSRGPWAFGYHYSSKVNSLYIARSLWQKAY